MANRNAPQTMKREKRRRISGKTCEKLGFQPKRSRDQFDLGCGASDTKLCITVKADNGNTQGRKPEHAA